MQRLIQNKISERLFIINHDNSCISERNRISDINEFNNLSNEIFDNFNLYLGKDYYLFNIDIDFIKNLLLNKDIYKDNNGYYCNSRPSYKLNKQYLYYYNEKNKTLYLDYDIWPVVDPNWKIVRILCTSLLEQHHNWVVDKNIWCNLYGWVKIGTTPETLIFNEIKFYLFIIEVFISSDVKEKI